MKLKLIENWRSFWRFWSLRFITAGGAILSYITISPEAIIGAWNAIPQEFKQYLPPNYLMWIALILIVLGAISRIVKQSKLPTGESDGRL